MTDEPKPDLRRFVIRANPHAAYEVFYWGPDGKKVAGRENALEIEGMAAAAALRSILLGVRDLGIQYADIMPAEAPEPVAYQPRESEKVRKWREDVNARLMYYRPHRGSLSEAVKETAIIDRTLPALVAHLRLTDWLPSGPITMENVTLVPNGYDDRIGWDTYLVCVNGEPRGMTDGPVPAIVQEPTP